MIRVGESVDDTLEERLQQKDQIMPNDNHTANGVTTPNGAATNGTVPTQNGGMDGIENMTYTGSHSDMSKVDKGRLTFELIADQELE